MNLHQKKEAVTINIRAKSNQKDLIDLAAERQGRSRSEFMLDVACREAEAYLLDQAFFSVSEETFESLLSLVEKPLPSTDKLRRLMNAKTPWGK